MKARLDVDYLFFLGCLGEFSPLGYGHLVDVEAAERLADHVLTIVEVFGEDLEVLSIWHVKAKVNLLLSHLKF